MLWKKEINGEKKNEGKGRKDVKVGRKRRRKWEGGKDGKRNNYRKKERKIMKGRKEERNEGRKERKN